MLVVLLNWNLNSLYNVLQKKYLVLFGINFLYWCYRLAYYNDFYSTVMVLWIFYSKHFYSFRFEGFIAKRLLLLNTGSEVLRNFLYCLPSTFPLVLNYVFASRLMNLSKLISCNVRLVYSSVGCDSSGMHSIPLQTHLYLVLR